MFPIVADHVKEAMGDVLFDKFLVNKQNKNKLKPN